MVTFRSENLSYEVGYKTIGALFPPEKMLTEKKCIIAKPIRFFLRSESKILKNASCLKDISYKGGVR